MLCRECKNVGEGEVCAICTDHTREKSQIIVVASPMDAFAIEKTGFKGLYHVLHGVIDPLNNVGPEELFINDLIARLHKTKGQIDDAVEVIIATNSSMEGESTAMYIAKIIRSSGFSPQEVKLSRIARGLPVGGDIEYADDITLTRAIEGRIDL